MTPEQQADLRARAHSDPTCTEAIAKRDITELARILSIGLSQPTSIEVGNGTILETIGVEAGNTFLDHINSDPSMRHVKPLLEQGRLRVGSAVAQSAIRSFAANGVITDDQANALCKLGMQPRILSPQEVAIALFNEDGTEK